MWITADGRLTTPPLNHAAVIREAATTGAAAFLGVVLAAGLGYGLLCSCLARRRDRQWTQGWAAVGPVWRAQPR